jgi:hypothetical protein
MSPTVNPTLHANSLPYKVFITAYDIAAACEAGTLPHQLVAACHNAQYRQQQTHDLHHLLALYCTNNKTRHLHHNNVRSPAQSPTLSDQDSITNIKCCGEQDALRTTSHHRERSSIVTSTSCRASISATTTEISPYTLKVSRYQKQHRPVPPSSAAYTMEVLSLPPILEQQADR